MKFTLKALKELFIIEAKREKVVKFHLASKIPVRSKLLDQVDTYLTRFNLEHEGYGIQRTSGWSDGQRGWIECRVDDHTNPHYIGGRRALDARIVFHKPDRPEVMVSSDRGGLDWLAEKLREGLLDALELQPDTRGYWWADENLYAQRPVYSGEWLSKPPVKGWVIIDPTTGEEVKTGGNVYGDKA